MDQSILVVNCGSSSVKLALYRTTDTAAPIITALAERLGGEGARLRVEGEKSFSCEEAMDHSQALATFIEECQDYLQDLAAIGHRLVHGGEAFHESTLITDDSLAELEKVSVLAPLHNPMNLMGIRLCRELLPDLPNVAVFDTSFHQTMPAQAYLYGVPYDWYETHQVRRYGFHGTSYRYVSAETARRLNRPADDLNLIIAHLGNGCSACAIRQGQSVDSSMGLTPLEGLIMGTRSGDIDPGLLEHMMRESGSSMAELMTALNRNSGLLGLSGISNDMRTLLQHEAAGEPAAKRALDTFCFRVARQLAALSSNLSGTDAVVFTGGIGENSADIRRRILANWRNIQFRLNTALNQANGDESGRISETGTPLVLVIPTDEEQMIAQDTLKITGL